MTDSLSFLLLFFLNGISGILSDHILATLLNRNYFIKPILFLTFIIFSFLVYLENNFLLLLNGILVSVNITILTMILITDFLELFFRNYGANTLTNFAVNNLRIIFVELSGNGLTESIKIGLVLVNIITRYLGINPLCRHTYLKAIAAASINNHAEILEVLLLNFIASDEDGNFIRELINHISRLGHFNVFKILVNKTNIKLLDSSFYELHSQKLKIDQASSLLKENYEEAIKLFDIPTITSSISENCMICHESHDNIIKLPCGHYVCLESFCAYYCSHLSEDLVCFICREKIDFKNCISYSKL